MTEVVEAPAFWPAEEYHQDYWEKNPGDGYCEFSIAPKIRKVKDEKEYKTAKL